VFQLAGRKGTKKENIVPDGDEMIDKRVKIHENKVIKGQAAAVFFMRGRRRL